MALINSNWVSFLRQYGPIPKNDNMYDETIQRLVKRKRIKPILIDAKYLQVLIDNFTSEQPKSVILTGTAGDGKTFHCREVWIALGGTYEQWEEPGYIKKLSLPNNKVLHVVKDLSELEDDEKKNWMILFSDAVKEQNYESVFLIAANDGQLIEAFKQAIENNEGVSAVKNAIEDMLVNDSQVHPTLNLCLYNLSHISAAWALPSVIDSVTSHTGWNECDACELKDHPEIAKRCPIWENKKRLESVDGPNLIRSRLIDLLELCEINGIHLPVRQLLLLISNMLLGHPDANEKLLTCQQVPAILDKQTSSKASIYRNIFGENLSERQREKTDVFSTLNRFGIGNETSNSIDNILIFGEDDPELKELYQELVLKDEYYGADQTFKINQKAYLEGSTDDEGKKFLELVRAQRQRLFFSIPDDKVNELKLWQLTTFQYAGEFLTKVHRVVQNGGRTSPQLLSRLVRGLNRISTGVLTKTQDKLILATSGSHSQAKVSKIFESSLSVIRDRGESVQLRSDAPGKLYLEVSFSASATIPPVKLHLQLVRYEFLSRVAEGALPGSFSRECYEDILAFKSRLLKQLERRRKEDDQEDLYMQDGMSFNILKLNSDGTLDKKTVEVLF